MNSKSKFLNKQIAQTPLATTVPKLILIETDPDFKIIGVSGDLSGLTDMSLEQLIGRDDVWKDLFNQQDLKELRFQLSLAGEHRREFSQEIRLLKPKDGAERWIFMRVAPQLDEMGKISAWRGFGAEITEQKAIAKKLLLQKNRLEALYNLSKNIHYNSGPTWVANQGLIVLIESLRADAGFIFSYDKSFQKIELIAIQGMPIEYVDNLDSSIASRAPFLEIVHKGVGRVINFSANNDEILFKAERQISMRSMILMPLRVDREISGGIVILSKKKNKFLIEDLELLDSAGSQLGMSIKQAQNLEAERYSAQISNVLYELSRELSKYTNFKDIAEKTFPIFQKILPSRRIWLGVLNDRGTHIAGQAGVGPGIRPSLANLQIDLSLKMPILEQLLRDKKITIISNLKEHSCPYFEKIFNSLQINNLFLLPLTSLGGLVGLVIFEPNGYNVYNLEVVKPILNMMANEIATVILARKLEAKAASADKMKMAALLTSGVAHNFNNLLQAVMGQASLIEAQSPAGSLISRSAALISEAAQKGSSLISELRKFAAPESGDKKQCDLIKFLRNSENLYSSLLGEQIRLLINLPTSAPLTLVDYSQLQQVVTNIILNAREAIEARDKQIEKGRVEISLNLAKLSVGEIDPELPPGEYLRIDITDNGRGMSIEEQKRCFEPFYTSKNADIRSGVGLYGSGFGLSSSYSIIRRHGGTIVVSSAANQGSIFSVFLPTIFSADQLISLDPENQTAINREHQKILTQDKSSTQIALIGCKKEIIDIIQSFLRDYKITVKNFKKIEEAIQKGSLTEYPLVFTSETAPDFDLETFNELAFKEKNIHFVLIVDNSIDKSKIKEGKSANLVKPFEILEYPFNLWKLESLIRQFAIDKKHSEQLKAE
ncbi:MAG TPA: ATP-binding protein [Oligoflexia bacterium]|nr:ATP-binding protein [Oligoflexia bacterium]HMP27652.1 ATP-binding protein [Oligoflexia bacterium]